MPRDVKYYAKKLKEENYEYEAYPHIKALKKIGTPEAVDALIKHGLNRYNDEIVKLSVKALGEIGNKKAVAPILKEFNPKTASSVPDRELLNEVLITLGKIGDHKAEKGVIAISKKWCGDWSWVVLQETITETLGQIGGKKAAEHLLDDYLEHKETRVNSTAKHSIVKIGAPAVKPIIDRWIAERNQPEKDKDYFHIEEKGFASLLGQIGTPKAVDAVLKYGLTHKDEGVVSNAAFMLGEKKEKRAVKPLISLLKHNEVRIVEHAASALGEIGDKKALIPLMKIAGNSEKEYTNKEIKKAINKIQEANKRA